MTEPIERIEAALAELGAEHEPPEGWEARVLAQTVPQNWWRHLLRWQVAAVVVAAAVIVVVIIPRRGAFALATDTREPDGAVMRGGANHVGQILRAAATGGDRQRAIWLYRDDRLLVACPGAPSCASSEDGVTVELGFETAGSYRVVALNARAPIAPPHGDVDTDVLAAQSAGAKVVQELLTVR